MKIMGWWIQGVSRVSEDGVREVEVELGGGGGVRGWRWS